VFWHSVAVPDLEPRALRHLLHWCYRRPPCDVDHLSVPSQFERDVVHLYAAADRYLLEPCMQLAAAELRKVHQRSARLTTLVRLSMNALQKEAEEEEATEEGDDEEQD
jgi:hypothetical protein